MSLGTLNLESKCFLPFLSFQTKIFKVLKSEYLTFWTINIRPLISDPLWGFQILVWKLSSLEHPGSLEALSRCWERWLDIILAGLGVHCGLGFTLRVLFLFILPLVRWVSVPSPTKHYCISLQQCSLVEKERAVRPAKLGLAVWSPTSWPWTWRNYRLYQSVRFVICRMKLLRHFRAIVGKEGRSYIKLLAFSSSRHSFTAHQNHNYLQSFLLL